ncbi:zinc-dependent alcohol dehydrogenase [Amaricoccus macauensis]|uniref:zinc-dependent alcohol dehydrogenase n=1 Tax=Amaricoccus macauensis TaxID=57001 RepID=UPI003C7C46E7
MPQTAAETATAFWIEAPGKVCLRKTPLQPAQDGEVLVRMLFSGISRGTERLVHEGRVPSSEHDRMRAPFMHGDFPFPVSYGYMGVGRVEDGPDDLRGRNVFCLHPHHDRFRVPASAVTPLPEGLPAERAVLGANMETALNIVWDARIGPGDRVSVIGAGVVGLLSASLAASMPGTSVSLIDTEPARAETAGKLGMSLSDPSAAETECDVVIHTSATASGLATAIACAGLEARIVEASWHGAGTTEVPLGGAFHSKRLSLVSSQVGHIPADRRARWSFARRLRKALELLMPDRFDALISGETAFGDLPGAYAGILADPTTLCHRIRYD